MSSWKKFEMVDPFNPGNTVKGELCMSSGSHLGSIRILSVNGVECDQMIECTPKIHYPFDMDGQYSFPPNYEVVQVYEKLDGTNILAFAYRGSDGQSYVSYKTRSTPFIDPEKQADFYGMWCEMLAKYPNIPSMVAINGKNIAFELYGLLNKHGILYDVSLETRVLFARDNQGNIYPPCEIKFNGVDYAPAIGTIPEDEDLKEHYNSMINWLNGKTEVVSAEDADEFEAKGMEGTVWYVKHNGGWTMYKCKGDKVREEHMAQAGETRGIPSASISQAIFKVLEEGGELNYHNVIDKLKEDFGEEEVYKYKNTLHRASRMVESYRVERTFREGLFKEYERLKSLDNTFDIIGNKGRVMQTMAQWMVANDISKKYAGKVYSNLVAKYGGKK